VALSAPAVQRRIKRLRAAGVIEREVAVVNPAAVGLPMTFVVIVELERESAGQIDAFRRKVAAEPQVQQGYYVTGEGDFVLVAVARDMDDFEALTRRLFFEDPNVRRFRTSVAMGRAFRSLNVPAGHAVERQGE
jgi:DNA-binding Lrp family transcriptional regulator